jgi:hypothetical protein
VARRRSRYADDFILDDGGFADPRLGAGRACGKPRSRAKRGDAKNAVAPIHFITDRFIPSSYRTTRAHDVVNLHKSRHTSPVVSGRETEMRSMQWT